MPPTRRSARTVSGNAARQAAQPYTRSTANTSARTSSASIDRNAEGSKPRLNLTVKAPPSKLRQATSASSTSIPPNPYADTPSESDAPPQPASRPARSTRNPKVVVDPDSEEVDDDDMDAEGEEVEDEDMADDIDQQLLANEDSEEDAEGEEDDDIDELQQDQHPPPPVIKQTNNSKGKPQVQVIPPNEGPMKSVEDKEMDDDDDDELSELEEDDEQPENEGAEADDDDDLDSDDEDLSRSATPDITKLTKRQRGLYVESEEPNSNLMSLSNEAQKKKHLTAEEHAMRRAEMARRRKNLSEKRNEEEKVCT
jgi:Ino eighty subunit 2